MEKKDEKFAIWQIFTLWLIPDYRSLKCLGISLLCHICILTLLFLIMMFRTGYPHADEVSILCSAGSEEEEQQRPGEEEPKPKKEDKETDAQTSQDAAEIAKELQDSVPVVEHSEAKPGSTTSSQEERDRQNRKVNEGAQGRSKYGVLEPKTFFGMRVYAKNMVFVLDVSGSMDIREARIQLKNAYHSLSEHENFSIVSFSNNVSIWQDRLQPATEANRQAADAWVETLAHGGSTNFYGGLETAFNMASEFPYPEIYIVSDGMPNVGKVTGTEEILAEARRWNKNRKEEKLVKINTIGIGMHQDRLFLERLAEENGGKYLEK